MKGIPTEDKIFIPKLVDIKTFFLMGGSPMLFAAEHAEVLTVEIGGAVVGIIRNPKGKG